MHNVTLRGVHHLIPDLRTNISFFIKYKNLGSRECQIRDWKKGGHRNVCKEYELATTISSNSNNNSSNDDDDDEGEEGDNSNRNRKSNDDEGEEGTSRQLVKIVATEQIGTCIGRPLTSTPATSSDEDVVLSHVGGIGGTITKYPIIIDGGTDIENDDEICITLFERNEFDPMCYRCNILDGTKKRCSKCKQVWYCKLLFQIYSFLSWHFVFDIIGIGYWFQNRLI